MVHIWPNRSPVNINMTCSLSENPGSYYHSFQYFSASISSICGIMLIKQKKNVSLVSLHKEKIEVTQPWIFLSINSLTNMLNKKERDQVVSKWTLNLTELLLLIEETISNALWVKPAFISFMLICAILRILLSCIKRKMFWWNVHIYNGFIKVVFR